MSFRSQSSRSLCFAAMAIIAAGALAVPVSGARVDPISAVIGSPSTRGAGGLGAPGEDSQEIDLTPLAELARGLVIDVAKLAGPDQKLGEREAYRLLSQVDVTARARQVHLDFLVAVLHPEDVGKLGSGTSESIAERVVVAQRIVQAIALGGRDGGPPFEHVADVLLPLLGRGPDELREAVVSAVLALTGWERQAAAGEEPPGPTVLDVLGARITGGVGEIPKAPPATVLADVSRILWEVDGKRFLDRAITGMILFNDSAPQTVSLYLGELRSRLLIDFPSPQGWKEWWDRHKDMTLPRIFTESQRKLSADQAAAWRVTLKRLSENDDPERLTSELEAVLESEYTVEKRLVAVAAFGEFPDWVRTLKLPGAAAEQEKVREAYLARSCGRLIDVARGMAREHEYPEVSRAALAALSLYQQFLERDDFGLRARLVQLIDARFERVLATRPMSSGDTRWAHWKAELIELVRAAGALKVLEARVAVEGILSDPDLVADIAMIRASLQAIGRMVKSGLSLGTANLVVRVFEAAKSGSGQESFELRADCASVLEARPEDETVRDFLRTFHVQQLHQHEEPKLHIPAIGGLSTLAQGNDERAREALVDVLASPERYDTQVLIAVVNAVAYVGGNEALEQFLPFLRGRRGSSGKEKDIADHLLSKVKGTLVPRGVEGLDWLLARLETRAYAVDDLAYLRFGLDVVGDPKFGHLLLVGSGESTATNGDLRASWSASLAHLRAVELTTGDAAAAAAYGRLVGLSRRAPLLKEKVPELLVEFEERLVSRRVRGGIVARIASVEPIDLQAILKGLTRLVDATRAPLDLKGSRKGGAGEGGADNGGAGQQGTGQGRVGESGVGESGVGRGEGPGDGGGGGTKSESVGTGIGDPSENSLRALRTRWTHLRWIESLLASESVVGDERFQGLGALWLSFLTAEENAGLWKGLPEGFQDRYIARLQALPLKSEEARK